MKSSGVDNLSATDRLRNDILSGVLPPGERLVELQLAERYRLGRAAIRAALLELDSEGLVRREANRGATVRRISLSDAIEITQARGALEGLVARLAAERATDQERADLQALVAEMETAVANDARLEYADLNRALHRTLLQIARHE